MNGVRLLVGLDLKAYCTRSIVCFVLHIASSLDSLAMVLDAGRVLANVPTMAVSSHSPLRGHFSAATPSEAFALWSLPFTVTAEVLNLRFTVIHAEYLSID